MTFKDAAAKLADLARGKYHTMEYSLKVGRGVPPVVSCSMYIDGYNLAHGSTWREALDNMDQIQGGGNISEVTDHILREGPDGMLTDQEVII